MSTIEAQTSVIIDGVFLEKAIGKTGRLYKDIYPEKQLDIPEFIDFMGNLLASNASFFPDTSPVECYLFMSSEFSLEYGMDIDMNRLNFMTCNGYRIILNINKTDDFISFNVIELLEKIYFKRNIILLANDISYEQPLEEFRNKSANIRVVTFNPDDGSHLHTRFGWSDIARPLALSMGLARYEL